jgi:hypothetical protein
MQVPRIRFQIITIESLDAQIKLNHVSIQVIEVTLSSRNIGDSDNAFLSLFLAHCILINLQMLHGIVDSILIFFFNLKMI